MITAYHELIETRDRHPGVPDLRIAAFLERDPQGRAVVQELGIFPRDTRYRATETQRAQRENRRNPTLKTISRRSQSRRATEALRHGGSEALSLMSLGDLGAKTRPYAFL